MTEQSEGHRPTMLRQEAWKVETPKSTETSAQAEDLNAPEETTGEIQVRNLEMIRGFAKDASLTDLFKAINDTQKQLETISDAKAKAEISENLEIYKTRALELLRREIKKTKKEIAEFDVDAGDIRKYETARQKKENLETMAAKIENDENFDPNEPPTVEAFVPQIPTEPSQSFTFDDNARGAQIEDVGGRKIVNTAIHIPDFSSEKIGSPKLIEPEGENKEKAKLAIIERALGSDKATFANIKTILEAFSRQLKGVKIPQVLLQRIHERWPSEDISKYGYKAAMVSQATEKKPAETPAPVFEVGAQETAPIEEQNTSEVLSQTSNEASAPIPESESGVQNPVSTNEETAVTATAAPRQMDTSSVNGEARTEPAIRAAALGAIPHTEPEPINEVLTSALSEEDLKKLSKKRELMQTKTTSDIGELYAEIQTDLEELKLAGFRKFGDDTEIEESRERKENILKDPESVKAVRFKQAELEILVEKYKELLRQAGIPAKHPTTSPIESIPITDPNYDPSQWAAPEISTPPGGKRNPLQSPEQQTAPVATTTAPPIEKPTIRPPEPTEQPNKEAKPKPAVEKSTGLLNTLKKWGRRLGLAGLLMGAQPSDVTPHNALDEDMKAKIEYLDPSGVDVDADKDSDKGVPLPEFTITPDQITAGLVGSQPERSSITAVLQNQMGLGGAVRLTEESGLMGKGIKTEAIGNISIVPMSVEGRWTLGIFDAHSGKKLTNAETDQYFYDLPGAKTSVIEKPVEQPQTKTAATKITGPSISDKITGEQTETAAAAGKILDENVETPEPVTFLAEQHKNDVATIEISGNSALEQSALNFQKKILSLPYPNQQLVEAFKKFVLDIRGSADKEILKKDLAILNNQYELAKTFPDLLNRYNALENRIAELGVSISDTQRAEYAKAVVAMTRLKNMIEGGNQFSLNQITAMAKKAESAINKARETV